MKKYIIVAIAAMALVACGSKNEKQVDGHVETVEHEYHSHVNHAHEVMVAGIAQSTDTVANHITIVKLHDGTTQTFDYSSTNPDKIAAWQAGDTVTVFLHHHHHGNESHDSITAVKIGNFECNQHEHETCAEEHDHECNGHDHHHAH